MKSFSSPLTRRGLLSLLMSVFDPLGMVAPFLLPLKILIQSLTKTGLHWDAEIPDRERNACNKLVDALANLSTVTIPRCFAPIKCLNRVQLHVFADASNVGIGAVCYLRIFS